MDEGCPSHPKSSNPSTVEEMGVWGGVQMIRTSTQRHKKKNLSSVFGRISLQSTEYRDAKRPQFLNGERSHIGEEKIVSLCKTINHPFPYPNYRAQRGTIEIRFPHSSLQVMIGKQKGMEKRTISTLVIKIT